MITTERKKGLITWLSTLLLHENLRRHLSGDVTGTDYLSMVNLMGLAKDERDWLLDGYDKGNGTQYVWATARAKKAFGAAVKICEEG